MNAEERNERSGATSKFRSSLHIGMGVLYLVLGSSVIYMQSFGMMELGKGFSYGIGGLMLVYGVFRIWRGIVMMREKK